MRSNPLESLMNPLCLILDSEAEKLRVIDEVNKPPFLLIRRSTSPLNPYRTSALNRLSLLTCFAISVTRRPLELISPPYVTTKGSSSRFSVQTSSSTRSMRLGLNEYLTLFQLVVLFILAKSTKYE